MKKLLSFAVIAAMSVGAYAQCGIADADEGVCATVYKVKLSVKTTSAKTGSSRIGECPDCFDEFCYRKQASRSYEGAIFGCDCWCWDNDDSWPTVAGGDVLAGDTSAMLFWSTKPLQYFVAATPAIPGTPGQTIPQSHKDVTYRVTLPNGKTFPPLSEPGFKEADLPSTNWAPEVKQVKGYSWLEPVVDPTTGKLTTTPGAGVPPIVSKFFAGDTVVDPAKWNASDSVIATNTHAIPNPPVPAFPLVVTTNETVTGYFTDPIGLTNVEIKTISSLVTNMVTTTNVWVDSFTFKMPNGQEKEYIMPWEMVTKAVFAAPGFVPAFPIALTENAQKYVVTLPDGSVTDANMFDKIPATFVPTLKKYEGATVQDPPVVIPGTPGSAGTPAGYTESRWFQGANLLWDFIHRIDMSGKKAGTKVEAVGTLALAGGVEFRLAGFGTWDAKNELIKKISGGFAGTDFAPTCRDCTDCRNCTYRPAGYWDLCSEDWVDGEVDDPAVCAAYGTWSISYDSSASKKYAKYGNLYDIKFIPKAVMTELKAAGYTPPVKDGE